MSHKNYRSSMFLLVIAFFIATSSCEQKQVKKESSWKKPKAERIVIESYLDAAERNYKKLKFEKAYYYYYKAKTAAETKKDTSVVVYSLIKIANLHFQQFDYIESEAVVTQALDYTKYRKDHYYNFHLYMILGNIYNNNYDYKNAEYYFKKSLQFKDLSDINIVLCNNNIATIFIDNKKYDKAVKILEQIIASKELKKNDAEYARVISNLGFCYFKLGNPKALEYLEKSLEIRTKTNDLGIILSLFYMSEFYQFKDLKKAQDYAWTAYLLSLKINNKEEELFCLAQLIKLHAGNEAKEFSLKYIELNESLTKMRQIAKNQFAKIKYDSKQEKEENLTLKAQKTETLLELERHKNSNLLLLFLSFIGLTSTITLYCFWKSKSKKEKLHTAYETETYISKRLHDELANDVYNTMIYVETQDLNNSNKKEILLNQIETIYNRTRNISLENSEIETGDAFKTGLTVLISGYNDAKTNLIIKNLDAINWNRIKKSTKINIYRTIQELLVNMKKHSNCSLVVISFKSIGKTYKIEYSDNGIGCSNKLKYKNGLQNVENRIKNINGTITFETDTLKGFKTTIIFPR